MKNQEWLEWIPEGWHNLAKEMLQKIEAIDSTYEVYDMKEKWGCLTVYGSNKTREVYDILEEYSEKSFRTCCQCGQPAVKFSTGWVLPWCDKCGTDGEAFYKRFIT